IVLIAGNSVTVHLMTVVLGYSRRLFCRAFLAERQDDWLEGIDAACHHFGGLPEQILCDNASPLVTSHDPKTGVVVWHPGFAAFCKDRGITPRACRPRRARTKGKIERGVGYVKHNALAGRSFDSFAALQRHLLWWTLHVADRRIHGTTREQPIVRFERDERATRRTSRACTAPPRPDPGPSPSRPRRRPIPWLDHCRSTRGSSKGGRHERPHRSRGGTGPRRLEAAPTAPSPRDVARPVVRGGQ